MCYLLVVIIEVLLTESGDFPPKWYGCAVGGHRRRPDPGVNLAIGNVSLFSDEVFELSTSPFHHQLLHFLQDKGIPNLS
jgi:hypothetical protein